LSAGCASCVSVQVSTHRHDEIIAIRVESKDSVSAEVLRRDEFREIYFGEGHERFTKYEGRYERRIVDPNGLSGEWRMAGTVAGGVAVIARGMFIKGADRTLVIMGVAVAGTLHGFMAGVGGMGGMGIRAKSTRGQCEDDNNHDRGE
jgi:hypothetical protein